ncbi:MAG: fimbria/pilus periplasmic chaperone [Caenibius sp.]
MAFCAYAAVSTAAYASGLQVTPVSVSIPDRAGVIWLSNDATTPLRAQVRVFRWTQVDNQDKLEPTQDVLASPPFIEIEPGGRQVVRLVRFSEAAQAQTDCETPYRILVDELPATEAGPRTGLDFRLQYSIPVYLTSKGCDDAQPQLSWTIATDGNLTRLNVVNLGQTHAQLGRISFVNSQGKNTELNDGLLGYVLPGAQRSFALAVPSSTFAGGGQFKVMLNGSETTEPLSLAANSE